MNYSTKKTILFLALLVSLCNLSKGMELTQSASPAASDTITQMKQSHRILSGLYYQNKLAQETNNYIKAFEINHNFQDQLRSMVCLPKDSNQSSQLTDDSENKYKRIITFEAIFDDGSPDIENHPLPHIKIHDIDAMSVYLQISKCRALNIEYRHLLPEYLNNDNEEVRKVVRADLLTDSLIKSSIQWDTLWNNLEPASENSTNFMSKSESLETLKNLGARIASMHATLHHSQGNLSNQTIKALLSCKGHSSSKQLALGMDKILKALDDLEQQLLPESDYSQELESENDQTSSEHTRPAVDDLSFFLPFNRDLQSHLSSFEQNLEKINKLYKEELEKLQKLALYARNSRGKAKSRELLEYVKYNKFDAQTPFPDTLIYDKNSPSVSDFSVMTIQDPVSVQNTFLPPIQKPSKTKGHHKKSPLS